jgi:hypothetical protein
VTIESLASALHSGCALLTQKHSLSECPSKHLRRAEAKMLWQRMEKDAKSGG